MVRARIRNGTLVIDAAGSVLLEWKHRSFLTVATGFLLDESAETYSLPDPSRLPDTLRETVEYLREEGIAFESDSAVETLVALQSSEEKEYESALRQGSVAGSFDALSPDFVRVLKPHQRRDIAHLLAVGNGANFSVPGGGKTTVVYAAFDFLKTRGVVSKLLVIGPLSCFQPWEDEAIACFGKPLRAARLTGARSARLSLYLQASEYDLLLCSYQTAANDFDDILDLCKAGSVMMVIDESHNIKRIGGGVRAEAVLKLAPYAARRVILSGTPMPNDFTDLWTQFTFLWPARRPLGDSASYRSRCEDREAWPAIRAEVRPLFTRTTKQELGLPPVRFEQVQCTMSPLQRQIYHALSVKFLRELDLQPEDQRALREWRKARMVRLIQAASNPALLAKYSEEFEVPPLEAEGIPIVRLIERYPQFEIPCKVDRASRLVQDLLRTGEKVILWTSFVHNIRMLSRMLAQAKPFIVYGEVPRDDDEDMEFNREQQIRDFKSTSGSAVLLANPAACAESVSLHKVCHHAVYVDRTFNCGQYMQSLDRVHRIGLGPEEIVTYHLLTATDSIDETIERRLGEKQANMLRLLDDELPVGTFEVESKQMEPTTDEVTADFEQTMNDLRKQQTQETIDAAGAR